MIPILYESNETQFASNGLGRLRDCISCIVTEERNGVYELDFEYPVDGHNYSEIKPGRVVGATHDDSNDIQPFDIVSYQKTIRGTVQFHCVHISYRTLKLITYGTNINSLESALTMLGRAEPENPFTYEADFESPNFMASGDGTPRPVRQFLGGVEGSILDTYGGELLFDKFNVKLLRARGEYKPVTVRYGLNLTEYNEDADYLETYTSAVPYWHGADANGNDAVVVGDRVDSGLTAYNGRNDCSALDLTDKFETIPTKAALQSMALTMMTGGSTNLPAQSIEVKYIDLKNFGEYQTIANLIKCKLCDSINVVFPRYGVNARFKIVKTEYDVLQDRFESMELGKLSTTLAEALGITADGTFNERDYDFPVNVGETSITTTTGRLNSQMIARYGRVRMLRIAVQKSSATAAGGDLYQGKINTLSDRPLFSSAYGCGYVGSACVVASIDQTGDIVVRATGASVAANSSTWLGITYIAGQ